MKKNAILLCIGCMLTNVISAQVVQKHMALITKKTATWCDNCGGWGWTLQQQIESDNDTSAVVLQLHSSTSSGLYSTASANLQSAFPYIGYVPSWFVNGIDRTVRNISGGTYPTLTRSEVRDAADSTYNVPALANSAYTMEFNGSDLTVNTTTKFFSDTSGEYYLSVLLVEDDVVAYQDGIGSNAIHQNILRGSMSATAFGELICSGTVAVNSTFTKTFNKTLNSGWNAENISLALVIWKKEGSAYYYVNAYKDERAVGVEEAGFGKASFLFYPNPCQDRIQVIQYEMIVGQSYISISSIQGKEMIYQQLFQGENDIDLRSLSPGAYLLRIQNSDQTNVSILLKK